MSSSEPRDQRVPVGDLTDTLRNHAFIWNRDGMYCGGCQVPRTTPKSEYDHGEYERRKFENYEAYARHLAELVFTLLQGWRPPPRVIETADELEVLPAGCVIVASGEAYLGRRSARDDWPLILWHRSSGALGRTSTEAIAATHGDGVTVLWEPEEARRADHR